MIKKICLIFSCFVPLLSYAMEEQNAENFKMSCLKKSEALQKATDSYLGFINKISKGEVFPQMETAAQIISQNCKKVLNGQLFTQNREDFVKDLLSVYKNQGSWENHTSRYNDRLFK